MARPTSSLDIIRARIRRAQLTVGIGFISLVLGMAIVPALTWRLGPRIQSMNSELAFTIARMVTLNLWVIAVLPLLCYAVARVIPLRPVPTAVGAALTGELIYYSIAILSGGFVSILQDPGDVVRNVAMGVAGVVITMWAIRTAIKQKETAEADAQKAAAAKKSEYDDFAKEAERLAALRDKPPETPPAPPPDPPTGGTSS